MVSPQELSPSMKQRSVHIDLTKGLLTVGMVFAHVIQLLATTQIKALKEFSLLTNLVLFSGFLFCFGFAAWAAYLQWPKLPWASTSLKCYLAFIVSGVAYRILVNSEVASGEV
jgi:hypothetical protein